MEYWEPLYSYYRIEKGGKMGQWYGYKTYQRLYGTSEEAAANKGRNPTTGVIQNYWNNYESAGDIYIQDLNGDGVINASDKTFLGSFIPKLFGGFGLDLRVGESWFVSSHFTYELGHKRFWQMPASDVGYTGNYNQSNKIAGMSAVMRSPHDPHTLPNATPYGDGGNGEFSDYWLYDASYVKLSTLSVRYRFNNARLQNTVLENIELSLQVDNLFTLTKYPGFDPQGNFSTGTNMLSQTQGIDYSYYPAARAVTLGVKLTF